MTLSEAYEALIKLHEQKDTIPYLNESCTNGNETDCFTMNEHSDRPVFKHFLSSFLNISLA